MIIWNYIKQKAIKNDRNSYEIQRVSVKLMDAGKSLKSIFETYKIGHSTLPSTVSKHKAGKNRISESLNNKWNSNRRSTKSSFPEAEKSCVMWFLQPKDMHSTISDTILHELSLQAEFLGFDDYFLNLAIIEGNSIFAVSKKNI